MWEVNEGMPKVDVKAARERLGWTINGRILVRKERDGLALSCQ
jgi:hypothetical protein